MRTQNIERVLAKKDWLDGMHEVVRTLRVEASSLRVTAQAFEVTGQGEHADYLFYVAENLYFLAGAINKLTSQKVSEDLEESRQATANMVSAALAVASRKEE